MVKIAGNRELGHGDQDTRENATGSTINAGEWVVPTGDETIDLADAANGRGSLVGVAGEDIEDGDEAGTVNYRGVVYARVEQDVSAGDELGAPDTGTGIDNDADTAGVAAPTGDSGHYALGDAFQDDNSNYIAKVLLR